MAKGIAHPVFYGDLSKIEKVPRGIRDKKSSKDMASSRNLVSTIGALASPKMGDGTRCPDYKTKLQTKVAQQISFRLVRK